MTDKERIRDSIAAAVYAKAEQIAGAVLQTVPGPDRLTLRGWWPS